MWIQLQKYAGVTDWAFNSGETPMHPSCWQGHLEIVKELVKRGASIFAQDQDGNTPLDWAHHCHRIYAAALRGKGIEEEMPLSCSQHFVGSRVYQWSLQNCLSEDSLSTTR